MARACPVERRDADAATAADLSDRQPSPLLVQDADELHFGLKRLFFIARPLTDGLSLRDNGRPGCTVRHLLPAPQRSRLIEINVSLSVMGFLVEGFVKRAFKRDGGQEVRRSRRVRLIQSSAVDYYSKKRCADVA